MTTKPKQQREPVSLEQRREPIQARAQASRARILAVAGELLEEVGIDDFNTNLLAERAGVLIRTVYRYFPNKFAVIATLGEEMIARWGDWMGPHIAEIAHPDSDLERAFREMLEAWLKMLTEEKGGRAIMQAVGAVPQLRELDNALFTQVVARYQAAISTRFSAPAETSAIASNLIVSAIYGVADCYFRVPSQIRPTMPVEAAKMVAGHLRKVVGDA